LLQFEHGFDAVYNLQPALLVDRSHIATSEPAVFETVRVRLRVVELLGHQTTAFEANFPFPHADAINYVGIHIV